LLLVLLLCVCLSVAGRWGGAEGLRKGVESWAGAVSVA
jgi:hypothetical protein